MDINRILLITLIAVAILGSVSAVSAGLFDGLLGGEQDNVIEIDDFTFNTTNATDFVKTYTNASEDGLGKDDAYVSDNGTGYSMVFVIDYSELYEVDNTADEQMIDAIMEGFKDTPYQTVNGIVIYPSEPVYYDVDVKQMYSACVQNKESHKIIMLSSPDPNETAKMASTLEFK